MNNFICVLMKGTSILLTKPSLVFVGFKLHLFLGGDTPHDTMAKVLDYDILVSSNSNSVKFTFIPWKRYEPSYLTSHGLNSTTTVLQEWVWHLNYP